MSEEKKEIAENPALNDKLLKTRSVMLTGEITKESADQVIRQLLVLDSESSDPITIYINSPGGDVDGGFAIYDTVRFISAPVTMVGLGLVASAAALVLLAVPNERRVGLPTSSYLIHQPLSKMQGVTTDVLIHANVIERLRAKLDKVIADATKKSVSLWATLTITTDETTLYEKEVTVSCNSNTASGTFSSTGTITLQIPWIGETTITSTDGTDTATSKVTISAYETSYSKELSFLKIVTFADGTDEEILAMIQAHYDNKINVADYWAVGDTRNVDLSAMEATYVGESHRAQTVQYRISDFEHYDLVTEINGHTKAAILVDQVNCLMDAECEAGSKYGSSNTENGYMNSSNTNSGGWGDCARRKWCNEVYLNAMPEILRNAVKEVKIKTSAGNQSTTIVETNDKIFLPSEVEIFGSIKYSVAGEGEQYACYKNATANRYKLPKWSSSNASNVYWERSPYSGSSTIFCYVNADGIASITFASSANGVAPCLCI